MADTFQYDPSRFEYTPEISEAYLKARQRPVERAGTAAVGKARGESLRRGLEGDPFEALRVGAAERGTREQLGDIESGLAYQGAGLRREERMGYEKFGRESEFEAGESAKTRAFQQQMAELQFSYDKQLAQMQYDLQQKASKRAFWPGLATGIVSGAAGMATGKYLFSR